MGEIRGFLMGGRSSGGGPQCAKKRLVGEPILVTFLPNLTSAAAGTPGRGSSRFPSVPLNAPEWNFGDPFFARAPELSLRPGTKRGTR